jgi:hypothetical protein
MYMTFLYSKIVHCDLCLPEELELEKLLDVELLRASVDDFFIRLR